jgi:glutathione synthase/RimK-type ligase-like ATP-grasp enzyme
MKILVLGNSTDAHAAHVLQALRVAEATAEYWDTALFPRRSHFSWYPHTATGIITLSDGSQWSLAEVHSVFWRSLTGVQIPPLPEPGQEQIALQDAMSLLRSLLQVESIHWVNSWQAYQFHKEKPRQLSQVCQLGVKIPATLISNDSVAITEFVQQHPKVIFKPVYGGVHTQLVTAEHLYPDRLKQVLSIAPATFQEYIPGTNLRSYVIGDTVYTAEIRSPEIDFRQDPTAQLIPIALPNSIQQQCRAIARVLLLEWTAIDWRLTPAGDYIFLEANPSPMFLHFEQQTGYPITQQLVKLLMH